MTREDFFRIAHAIHHVGAKVAVICAGELVAYLRDDFPHIHDPGLWDFPGGERDDDETAIACAIRETEEEFGIILEEHHFVFGASYKSHQPGRADVAFFVAEINEKMVARIRFGNEGQCWRMMSIKSFLERADAVRELQNALRGYLSS
jgi:8-oxo-dGTP diphosphatase